MTEHRSEWINFEEEEKKSQERIKAALDIKVTGASMNRLEEIKERLEKVKRNPYDSCANDGMDTMVKWVQEFRDCAPNDISYLLQRLEIAQKALESANNKLGQISSKDFANGQLRYEAAKIIQEALHEIT